MNTAQLAAQPGADLPTEPDAPLGLAVLPAALRHENRSTIIAAMAIDLHRRGDPAGPADLTAYAVAEWGGLGLEVTTQALQKATSVLGGCYAAPQTTRDPTHARSPLPFPRPYDYSPLRSRGEYLQDAPPLPSPKAPDEPEDLVLTAPEDGLQPTPAPSGTKVPWEKLRAIYSANAKAAGWRACRRLDPSSRRKAQQTLCRHIRRLWEDCVGRRCEITGLTGLEWIEAYFAAARRMDNPHWAGRNDSRWRAHLDFFAREEVIERVLDFIEAGWQTPAPKQRRGRDTFMSEVWDDDALPSASDPLKLT